MESSIFTFSISKNVIFKCQLKKRWLKSAIAPPFERMSKNFDFCLLRQMIFPAEQSQTISTQFEQWHNKPKENIFMSDLI